MSRGSCWLNTACSCGTEDQQLATYIGWLLTWHAGGMAARHAVTAGVRVDPDLEHSTCSFKETDAVVALFFGLTAAVLAWL